MKPKNNPFHPKLHAPRLLGPRISCAALSAVLLGFTTYSSHAQATGFNQAGTGSFDYAATANWVGGTINGTWDASLALTGAQAVTFGSDLVLDTGLTFNYTGNYGLTLRGDGSNRTITLAGGIAVNPAGNQTVAMGSATGGQNLNVDLGGATRTLTVALNKTLNFPNVVGSATNANTSGLIIAGAGIVNLNGANTFGGGIQLVNGTLAVANATAFGTGTLAIGDTVGSTAVTLNSGANVVNSQNNLQLWNQDFTFIGTNTLDLGTGAVTMSASRNVTVTAKTLTVGGVIGGSGMSLTKLGAGTLVLNGTNTYTGGTIVKAGNLQLGVAPAAGSVTVYPGAGLITAGAFSTVTNWLASGGIATSSAGSVNWTASSSENINFSGYSQLMLGASVNSTYTGTLTPANNTYRLGGGGATLTLSGINALIGPNNLVVGISTTQGISSGSVTLSGTNDLAGATTVMAGTLKLFGAAGALVNSAISVNNGQILSIDSSTAGVTGTTRASAVTLSRGLLTLNCNNTANSIDTISGALTIDGGSGYADAVGIAAGTKNALLQIGSLARTNHGVALLAGTTLGANAITGATAGGNIQITNSTAQTNLISSLVGGDGTAGSTSIKILPWMVGDLGGVPSGNSNGGSTFVTYTAANGFRPLTTTEFVTSITDGTTTTDNVRLASGVALTLTTVATVNSLILSGIGSVGGGTLSVTSGAVLLNPSNTGGNVTLSSNLAFGSAEGVIGCTYNRATASLSGIVSGSGGITFYQVAPTSGPTAALNFGGAGQNTYTGDSYILSNVTLGSNTALPSFGVGSRTGDVYVGGAGLLRLSTFGGTSTLNGLNGSGGVIYTNSNAATLSFGDNNANGNFSGTISNNSGGLLSLIKTGSGTQILSGANSHRGTTTVINGTLVATTLANGGVASGIGQAPSAATNVVINGGTLQYTGSATSTDRLFQVGQTTNGGSATLDAAGVGALNLTNTGSITFGTNNQTRTLTLAGTNTADNTLSALISNNGTGLVAVTKTGTGNWMLAGANTYTGATTVNGGTLSISEAVLADGAAVSVAAAAVLNLTHASTDTVDSFFIDGVLQVAGEWGATGSDAAHQTARITGSGKLLATTGAVSSDPFASWIGAFTSLTGVDTDKTADPDHDGLSNFAEFALDGDPTSAAASGKIRSRIETVGADQVLVITLPVRDGAVFDNVPGPAADATLDNLIYTIAGTNDLAAFDQAVTEISVSAGGMPALSGAGWTYRSFRLNGAIGGGSPRGPKGFLRAAISEAP